MSSIRSEASAVLPLVNFDQKLTTEQSNEIFAHATRCLLDRLSEPAWERAGLYILACVTGNDVPLLCNYDPDVLDLGARDQAVIRQCLAFYSKRQDINLGVNREEAALSKFRDAESACRLTNQCFRAWGQGRFQFDPFVESILHASQRKISTLLGAVPQLCDVRPRFGPGATTSTPKKNACPIIKMGSMPACSSSLSSDLLAEFGPAFFGGRDSDSIGFEIHPSRVAFVPKTAKIDRAICTEPVLSGAIQNGLGDLMATRLRRVGIDIRDQAPNQRAALYGSISGASATLDLSSASDTVSTGLVEHLLPEPWYLLLASLRSPHGEYRKERFAFEKFSSMGNGFTFPLETLIFWALAQSVKDSVCPNHRVRVLVYGDDIIVPTEAAIPLMNVLRSLGFTPNASKSFWNGSFRESCGKDYVSGIDIRPVYAADAIAASDLFRYHNAFLARGDTRMAEFWKGWIDHSIRLYGPPGFGDGYLHSDTYSLKPVRPADGYGALSFEAWAHRPKRLKREIVKRLADPVSYRVPVWDPSRGEWSATRTQEVRSHVFHERHFFRVIRLATYTQELRSRPRTLTESDAARSSGQHVYADRRMPDPLTGDETGVFVVPGAGPVHRVKICIFAPPKS